MNIPKRHHFIPQWLMKHWSLDGRSIFALDRREKDNVRAFKANTENVNVQRHLYSYERSDGSKDTRLESEFYSKLDAVASNLTKEIIRILDNGKVPDLQFEQRVLLWQFYIYNARKRLPRVWEEYIDRLDHDSIRRKTIEVAISKGYSPAEVHREIEAIEFDKRLEKLSVQRARAIQSTDVLNELGNIGVNFIRAPNGASFILPDISFEIAIPKITDSKPLYVPISPNYAISPFGQDGQCVKTDIDIGKLRDINNDWFLLSATVISTSTDLLKTLSEQHHNQLISY